MFPGSLGLPANGWQEQPAYGHNPEPGPPPVAPKLSTGFLVRCDGSGFGCQARGGRVHGLDFQSPGDLDAVCSLVAREFVWRNGGEGDIGQPRLTVGSGNEESTGFFCEKAPAHIKGLLNECLRLTSYWGGVEQELPEANDAANHPD